MGERFVLLPEKAAFWPAMKTLFVADFHLGKAASFRRAGIPLPPGTTTETVERLGRAVDKTRARRVVFLGDFLHSAEGRAQRTFAKFGEWRQARAKLELTVVRGNHDVKAGDPPDAWGARCIEAGERLGPFVLNHEPGASRSGYARAHTPGGAPECAGNRRCGCRASGSVALACCPRSRIHRLGGGVAAAAPGVRDRRVGSAAGRLMPTGASSRPQLSGGFAALT
jgi:DNA ligase-associated metallophosphoesterase